MDADKDDFHEYIPGIKQSGNAKITFCDEEYFKKVSMMMMTI